MQRSLLARPGKVAVVAAVIASSVFSIGGALAIGILQSGFSVDPTTLRDVTGIIVLGGGTSSYLVAVAEGRAPSGIEERSMIAIELAMRLPTTLILFTGAGESDPSVELQKRGIASERILLETESRTTAENARYSAKLLGDARHRTWILVSSASHMPRALACFRTAGFGAVPYRVDFVASLDPRFWPRAWREVASSLLYRLPNSLASVLPAALSRRCAVHKSEIAPSNA